MNTPLLQPVAPNCQVRLSAIDPNPPAGLSSDDLDSYYNDLCRELGELQELHYSAAQHALLVILQAIDAGGKDGVIRSIYSAINPVGCSITSFKVPTPEEQRHDFLWRVHKAAPERGMIGIWNRSHYEEVLIVRVHSLVPEAVWRQRYDQINAFERILHETNTIILKFFLYISPEEQQERLIERELEVRKAWKLSAGDWAERGHWNSYMAAYEDVLNRCSTEYAPWYIVPANKKTYRNIVITEAMVHALRPYRQQWEEQQRATQQKALSALEQIPERNAARKAYEEQRKQKG